MKEQLEEQAIKPFNEPSEKVFRAVKPAELYWESDNRVTSAVFDLRINEDSLSFDRADGREDEEACIAMHKKLVGKIMSLRVEQCDTKNTDLKHIPSKGNPYHSGLSYLTSDKKIIERTKHLLARKAFVEPY
jgi:hypothetical protein